MLADFEGWKAKGGTPKDRMLGNYTVIDVPPGTYKITQHGGEHDLDRDADLVGFSHIEPIARPRTPRSTLPHGAPDPARDPPRRTALQRPAGDATGESAKTTAAAAPRCALRGRVRNRDLSDHRQTSVPAGGPGRREATGPASAGVRRRTCAAWVGLQQGVGLRAGGRRRVRRPCQLGSHTSSGSAAAKPQGR
jgi:hypothetical protein